MVACRITDSRNGGNTAESQVPLKKWVLVFILLPAIALCILCYTSSIAFKKVWNPFSGYYLRNVDAKLLKRWIITVKLNDHFALLR